MGLIAESVSFGMAMFQREEQKDRLARMFATLSATNEAIMRANSREELFQLVCDAAMAGAKFTSATIGLAEVGSDFLRIVATSGPSADYTRNLRLAITAERPKDSYSIHTLRKPTLLQWVSRIRALGHQVLPQSKQVTLMTHIFRRAD